VRAADRGRSRLERERHRHQARQPLRAERVGQHADEHFGKAKLGLGRAGAVVAGELELEVAAEGSAVQRGDDRPVAVLDPGADRVVGLDTEVGIVERRQVAAGDEGPAGAGDDERARIAVVGERRNFALPESVREYIDNRVAAGNYGNTSEYIRDLVRRDQEEQAKKRLRDLIEEGLASGPGRRRTKADEKELLAIARGEID
jgi:antitoxin ParD1/3/4